MFETTAQVCQSDEHRSEERTAAVRMGSRIRSLLVPLVPSGPYDPVIFLQDGDPQLEECRDASQRVRNAPLHCTGTVQASHAVVHTDKSRGPHATRVGSEAQTIFDRHEMFSWVPNKQ